MANIKDVARAAGVSVSTVSRMLKDPSLVRPETGARIGDVIARLHFEPNQLASGLRRNRANRIIMAMPSIDNTFTSALLQGVDNIARANNFRTLLGITHGRVDTLADYIAMLRGRYADGIILLERGLPQALPDRLEPELRAKLVAVSEYPRNLELPRVRIDDHEASALVIGHLVEVGHRAIGAITGPLDQELSRARLSGFQLGLMRGRIEFEAELVAQGDFTIESGHEGALSLLRSGQRFTAIACANDAMALGAMRALREHGLRIPQDVSVTGFDDLRFGAFAQPALITVRLPIVGMGEAAMELLIDQIRLEVMQLPPRERILAHELVVRASTAPPGLA